MIKVTGKGGLLKLPPGEVQQLKLLHRMGSNISFFNPRDDNIPTSIVT